MALALSSDSPLAKRIVVAFLDFLSVVKLAPGTDGEGLEVAVQCLSEVFGVSNWQKDEAQANLLIDFFSSAGRDASVVISEGENIKIPSEKTVVESQSKCQCPLSANSLRRHQNSDLKEINHGIQPMEESPISGSMKESLFEQFHEGLESMGYFAAPEGTSEYDSRLFLAKQTFQKTFEKHMKGSTVSAPEQAEVLSESYKLQGNWAMSNNLYREAIDLYTLAISLCNNNAILFANRAAAHTQIGNSEAAIGDCNTAILIDPHYAKAYSRLGLAYYAQGRYEDAIEKGYKKAMELDPNSNSVRENLQAAQQKLVEQQRERQQQFGQCFFDYGQTSGSHGNNRPFSVTREIPPGLADIFPQIVNMATQFGDTAQAMQNENTNIHFHGSESEQSTMNFTLDGQQIPDFAGIMQSVLGAFDGRQGHPGATGAGNVQAEFGTPQMHQHSGEASAPARDHIDVSMRAPDDQSAPDNAGAGQHPPGAT